MVIPITARPAQVACGGPRFLLNTFGPSSPELARRYGLGLELLEYSIATQLDEAERWDAQVRERIAGIARVALHGPYYDLVPGSADPEIRRVTAARFGRAYELALRHGADRVVFHTGYVPRVYYRDAWLDSSAAFWRSFLAGKPPSPLVLLENAAEEDPELLTRILDRVADQRLGACLDIGHAHCNSPVALSDWIEALGPRMRHVHLSNNDGTADRHWRLDRGTIDMRAALEMITEHAPDATMTLECGEEERSVRWLMEQGYLKDPDS